ncbi:MAG: SDR family oxidoreductase [Actinobacteria bacterium]|nr:SDR family oxidoreductase [Actinomycetota bacterium]
MKVAVFGATGRTGRLLVEGALERGHSVTALVRAPDKLGALLGRVRVVRGDVLDGGVVSDVVDGQEAVLVALGVAIKKADPAINSLGTLNVIRSMQRYGTRRLVALSAGSAQPGKDPNAPWYFERVVKPLFLKYAFADLRRMETSVRQSELDWTLVRAARLVDGPARGGYRAEPGHSLPGGTKIARADVAAFMIDELERHSNIGHALAIAY